MLLKELCSLVEGRVICGESRMEESVEFAFASDLMSDVLTIKLDNFIIITGLANVQSVRTAEMSDVSYILMVRGKGITDEMLELAQENNILVISTNFSMFRAAGVLYGAGLKPVY